MSGNPARIYLDYAASAPVSAEVAGAMRAAAEDAAFNPSSLHAEGRRARALLDAARDSVAASLGARRSEITFTGSGTEADHLALTGVIRAAGWKGRVVASGVEHHAVLRALDALREVGCDVTILPVDRDGRVDPDRFSAALRDDTAIASVMYANNETGTVQPIAELAAIARARGVLFHTDAVQAAAWLPIDTGSLGVDLLSLSAHKFHGPKGAGILFVRTGTPFAAAIPGGGQEFGRRSGTENLAGIAGMAAALERAVAGRAGNVARVAALRERLESGILGSIPGVRINGDGAERLPSILSATFSGVDSESLLARLDLAGVAVSAGSACTSGTLEPSHVIRALGGDTSNATIRFSLGTPTTQAEIDRVTAILPPIVESLRRTSPAPA